MDDGVDLDGDGYHTFEKNLLDTCNDVELKFPKPVFNYRFSRAKMLSSVQPSTRGDQGDIPTQIIAKITSILDKTPFPLK